MAIGADFETAVAPFRRELVVHCYRMLGAVDEAEDVTQETLLRAWKARDRYDEQRASLRTWLYRIATNACLTALEGRARRPLPAGLGAPSDDPYAPLVPDLAVPWLQPLPARYLAGAETDPLVRAAERDGVRLALVAAMQLLTPGQRAVLLLRDVLRFSAAEVAAQLGTSAAAVNSTLRRARAALAGAVPPPDGLRGPDDRTVRATVERYVRAFEAADVDTLVTLLTEDAVLEMPPVPLWYAGRADYGRFIARVFALRGTGWRMVPTGANGQPALAAYCPDGAGPLRLHTLQVLTVTGRGIAHNVVFQDPRVFAAFALDPTLESGR
ncbi:sigma-70 family RNA polymerase sigma factor [Micromonospora auratinigra]|uniref:RNA polymerase sigma factor n=1 Tax=Micromonospora auratinigra TaxID=261654 RepID=A0A1A8ZNI3_9ACTN|nr:sigma-70 family RNA polymerase sigma factor [Micromonospora auratinigra]SBT45434.1 RNA polymerase sigma-70 factor, ECF subfamily [Micromonospora auratinigra]